MSQRGYHWRLTARIRIVALASSIRCSTLWSWWCIQMGDSVRWHRTLSCMMHELPFDVRLCLTIGHDSTRWQTHAGHDSDSIESCRMASAPATPWSSSLSCGTTLCECCTQDVSLRGILSPHSQNSHVVSHVSCTDFTGATVEVV
ncbi:hypothetical protein C8Q74DRAFT_754194 [Fomes fomentarius]|nr:hypothetical protein C8Q74DRAFT_754194 [Fomes fomentarius]